MNWRNPFLITYLSVTVAGAAIFGYLLYSGYTRYVDADTSYFDAVQKLHGLQNHNPYPSKQNTDKYIAYTREYRTEYDRLIATLAKHQTPLAPMTAEQFQDLLRRSVSEVVAAAKANGVKFGVGDTSDDNFYLGFDQYRGALPPDAAAAPLGRELTAIRSIVDRIIELKARRIQSLSINPLPQEGGAVVPPPRPTGGNNRPGNNRPGNNRNEPRSSGGVVTSNSFKIVFDADQNVARSVLNSIVNSSQFFIIRDITIVNSNEPPPPKVDPNAGAAGAAAPTGGELGIRVLAGLETVTVGMRIEIVNFNPPQSAR